ncbi:MAG: phosphoglycerate dehydrogenase [Actinobacteria bacterium]|nr:phosphoglycerate dehydrogenase [Actinomycetota bacterium]
MPRVLVTEKLAERGLTALADAGHDVEVRLGLSPAELVEAVAGVSALIVRSATKVTAEVLEAGTSLVVVGRAGVGVDNVDVEAATRRGVMVVNAPVANILSNAEHTMALLLSQARNISRADNALRSGRWERAKWEGVELYGKTLAILGLGNVGRLVAQRASSFGMRITAYDPFVAPDRGRQLGVELGTLDEVVAQADFIAVCLAKTPETVGIVGKDLLAKAKPGVRIVNSARGGLIDEDALNEALASGHVGGAALDVFDNEPGEGAEVDNPLFGHENVVVTPHLGASTREAQDKAGVTIAQQVVLALAGEFVPFAVNIAAAEASETVRPFLPLAEQLGRVFGSLSASLPDQVEIDYQGALAAEDTRILTLATLKGIFSVAGLDEPVSYVNAPQVAAARGLAYRESRSAASPDFVNLLTVRGGEHAISGTLAGARGTPRLVMFDGHAVEVPPAPNMLVVRNDDRAGMIGLVGTVLADAGVNIADMAVGRSAEGGTALMVLATDQAVPEEVVARLVSEPGILAADPVYA